MNIFSPKASNVHRYGCEFRLLLKRRGIFFVIVGLVLIIFQVTTNILPMTYDDIQIINGDDRLEKNNYDADQLTKYGESRLSSVWSSLKNYINGFIESYDYIYIKLEDCDCTRKIYLKEKGKSEDDSIIEENLNLEENGKVNIKYEDTTCSLSSFQRGAAQKVVGFSLYGDLKSNQSLTKGYFDGLVENLHLMPVYYKGWVMRLYHDFSASDPVMKDLCSLACKDPILDLCNVRNLPGTPTKDATKIFPMNWRFFPTMDPQVIDLDVDIFSSRDLDSRLNAREYAAVQEWRENSSKPIHVMRDHPQHTIGMLGAAWDADLTRNQSRRYWMHAWKSMLKDSLAFESRHKHGPDQFLLEKYVWRRFGRRSSLQHDAYLCQLNGYQTVGWPTKRLMEPNNFVAAPVLLNVTLEQKCPMLCRRHPDWEYC